MGSVRKTTRRRAREFTREEILDTARSMFVRDGYEAVTIRRIASKIGCAPGTIYLQFASKAEIFGSLCEETFSRLSARLSAIARDDDDPLHCLRRGGRAYIAFALEHQSQYILTFVMSPGGDSREADSAQPKMVEAGVACFENLRRMVARCVAAKLLRFSNVEEVSQVLWTSLHGLASLLITHSGFPFLERDRLIERQLDILMAGIGA